MANGNGANGHILGLKLQDGWVVVEDPGFGKRKDYIARLGRWVGIRKARVDTDTAEATERYDRLKEERSALERDLSSRLDTLQTEKDTIASEKEGITSQMDYYRKREDITKRILKESGITTLIDYVGTAQERTNALTAQANQPPLLYRVVERELEGIVNPLLGNDTSARICLNAGHELFALGLLPESRVVYEKVRADAEDISLSLGAEMGLLAIKEGRKELPSLGEATLGPEITAQFKRFVEEDPTLTIGTYTKKTLSSATQGGVKNQTSPDAFFVRASYQLKNNRQWDDSTAGLMKQALTQDLTLLDAALEVAAHYHNCPQLPKEISQGIVNILYSLTENFNSEERIKIGLEGYSMYETELSSAIDNLRKQKDDYKEIRESRTKLTQLVQSTIHYANPLYHTAQALRLQKEYDIAEEIGIALAAATNDQKYWKLIGDIVQESPTAARDNRKAWAQQCYQKAGLSK